MNTLTVTFYLYRNQNVGRLEDSQSHEPLGHRCTSFVIDSVFIKRLPLSLGHI